MSKIQFAILFCAIAYSRASELTNHNVTSGQENNIKRIVREKVLNAVDNSFWNIVQVMKNRLTNLQSNVNPDDIDDWTKCALGFSDVIGSFTRNRSASSDMMSALTMIDSGSKLPSGILKGNLKDLGQFDECITIQRLNIDIKLPGIEPVFKTSYSGHHCLIQISISYPSTSLSNNGSRSHKTKEEAKTTTMSFQLGECYPSTCKPDMIQTLWQDLLNALGSELHELGVVLSATVDPMTCHTSEGPPYDALDWCVLFIVCLIILIGISCTLIDMFHLQKALKDRSPTQVENLIISFSVHRNGRKLFSTTQNAEQMNCINGMKFCSICWVVLGHRYIYAVGLPLVNAVFMFDAVKQWHKMIIFNGILSVDTFFVISGLLNAYVFFNLMDKMIKYNLVTVLFGYLHRYLRLTPSFLLMIGITATWISRTGNGPLWETLAGKEKRNCRQYWWSSLIYMNNYINPEANCLMQSWYLAADMQMFWASPLLLYPLYRWPKIGMFNLLVATAASVASPFTVSYVNDIRAPVPINHFDDPQRMAFEWDVLYMPTHTKTVSYVFGIFIGYIIQKQRSGKLNWRLTWMTATIGWILGLTSLLYGLFGCYPLFQLDNTYTQLEASLYLGFYRLFWSIGVGWIIFACVSNFGGIVNAFLSLKPFGPLGRLSYCIYLTHITVLVYSFGITRTPIYFSDYNQVITCMGEMVIITTLATVLSLLLESPMMGIEKIIFGGRGGPQKRKQIGTTTLHPASSSKTESQNQSIIVHPKTVATPTISPRTQPCLLQRNVGAPTNHHQLNKTSSPHRVMEIPALRKQSATSQTDQTDIVPNRYVNLETKVRIE